MARIPPLEPEDTTGDHARDLSQLFTSWGRPWAVGKTIANAPGLLKVFLGMSQQMPHSSLGDDDREVINLYLAHANGCHYCVPAHTLLARETGLTEHDIAAILTDREPQNDRRKLVLRALKALLETKGGLSDAAYNNFIKAGLSAENLLDIIGEIAHCTITNYANRLARTEPDDFLKEVLPATRPQGIAAPKKTRYPLRAPTVG